MKPKFIHQIIDPQIFPLEIVIDAAYWLINRLSFRIEGDPNKEISVGIKPRFERISDRQAQVLFDDGLIDSYVTRYKWHVNSNVRRYFVHAALSLTPQETDIRALRDKHEILNPVDYQITQEADPELIVLCLDLQEQSLESLLPRLFATVQQLLSIAHFSAFGIKDGKLRFRIRPKNDFQMNELKTRLQSSFNALPRVKVF